MSVFLKNKLKCGLIRTQHTFALCFGPSDMISGLEDSVASLQRTDVLFSFGITKI